MSYNTENANESSLPPLPSIQPDDIENANYENNHGSSRLIDSGHFVDRFSQNNEPHLPYKHLERKNDLEGRLDFSPSTDLPSRKRRKVSSCDTPALPLESSLSRNPSESQVSLISFDSHN